MCLRADWDRVRMFDQELAQLFLQTCRKADAATVLDVTEKQGSRPRPLPLHTVELLRVSSSGLRSLFSFSLFLFPNHNCPFTFHLAAIGHKIRFTGI